MAEAYFVTLNRYQAPALVVIDGGQDDGQIVAEVVLIPAIGDGVFFRCLIKRPASSLNVLRAAVRALAEDEAGRRILEQPEGTRPDAVAFEPADLVAVGGRRSLLQQYPGIEAAATAARLTAVRSLLDGVPKVSNVKVFDPMGPTA